MKLKYLIVLLIFFILTGCIKNSGEDENIYSTDKSSQKNSEMPNNMVLDIPYRKLETFLGSKFIPVYSQKMNLDSDSDEEVAIAYKTGTKSSIRLIIFDILQNGIIRKKTEIETGIEKSDSFELSCHNLLEDNDIALLIEGKSNDNKSLLYIYQYSDDSYNKIGEFRADYSILVDYSEIEAETGKKIKLKEITTLDSSPESSNIQQKNVYVWDYASSRFTLAESSRIVSNDRNLSSTYLTDGNKFLEYVSGFWYPEKYLSLVKSPNFDPEKFNANNIEYLAFSARDMEVYIKHDDYMNKYKIKKVNLIWSQMAGVRLSIEGISSTSQFSNATLDVILTGSDSLQIISSNKFDESNYVRLDRPFIDYVNDRMKEKSDTDINKIVTFITDEFINSVNNTGNSNTGIIINFSANNAFDVQKGQKIEKGFYKITRDNLGYIITFLFDSDNTLLLSDNFLIRVFEDTQSISLTPIVMKLNGFMVDDSRKALIFKKRNNG